NAEDIAEIVLEAGGNDLGIDETTTRRIHEFTDQVDELTTAAVKSAVDRDFELTLHCRELFKAVRDREKEILADLPEMPNDDLLRIREVLVSLQETAGYAMRNVEIATNLALNEDSDFVTIR
ncbi:MAG: histidine kinase, partial [Halobacteriales archaeon]|nr:histidine kinase [Halobacteriales archaeon]